MFDKKAFILTLCILAFVLIFAACGSPATSVATGSTNASGGTSASPTATPAATPAAPAKNATLRFSTYSDDARMKAVNEIVAGFMKAYPNIKVEVERVAQSGYYEKKMAETAAKQLPDVWELGPGPGSYWIDRKMLLDIAPYVNKDAEMNIGEFDSTMIHYFTSGNALYGIPYDLNGVSLYYNKDLLDEAGIPYPDNTWTYDKLYEEMKAGQAALAAKGKKVWGLSAPINSGWSGVGFFDAMGTPLVDENGKIGVNETQTVQMLNVWLKWMKEGLIPTPEAANPQNVVTLGSTTFVNGKSLFHFGNCTITMYEEAKMNYGAAPAPLGPTNMRGAKLGSGFVISSTTKDPDNSYLLLKYFTSKDSIQSFVVDATGGIPTRKSLSDNLTGMPKQLVDNISNDGYTWINAVQGSSQIWTLKDTLLQQMWIGKLTPEQVVSQLQSEGTEALENASK